MELTIAILTANRNQLLQSLLRELAAQIAPHDEVIILDTANNTQTAHIVQSFPAHQFHYHHYVQPAFDFAAARNQLISLSSKPFISFIDDDALPLPGWINRIRQNLQSTQASGGPTVPSGNLPDWWEHSINWTIGLSPPGTALGLPGYYPDTCNLAGHRIIFQNHPFGKLDNNANSPLYASGREDAEWWKQQRINGISTQLDSRQIVEHPVHQYRINKHYIMQRARMDGEAFWRRNPHITNATDSPWDLAHIAGVFCDNFLTGKNDGQVLNSYVWLHREWGLFKAVWSSGKVLRPSRIRLSKELAKAALFQTRIRIGRAAFHGKKSIRTTPNDAALSKFPFFVSADCQIGDTVLLRRHINALAQNNPTQTVIVSARFPHLLSNLLPNITILDSSNEAHHDLVNVPIQKAFVPYYGYGDISQWRRHFSQVGITFDCDVGFPGRRDYQYAHKVIPKNLDLHEHENLARLFGQPSDSYALPTPPASYPGAAAADILEQLNDHGIGKQYILVQLGAGYSSKEWSVEKWITSLDLLQNHLNIPIIIIGDASWKTPGDLVIEKLRKHQNPMLNLSGQTSIQQLIALIDKATMLVGGCSGPKHIAFMVDTPTFTLYGPTEPYRWGATENHFMHAYTWPLGHPLTQIELKALDPHHRINLIQPDVLADQIAAHYKHLIKPGG